MIRTTALILFALIQTQVFAVNADDIPMAKSKPIQVRMAETGMGMVVDGFRVGVSKALLNGRLNSFSTDGDVRNNFTASLGYAYIPQFDLGFLGHVSYAEYEQSTAAVRVDGNVAFGLRENVYLFGGVNINKFIKGNSSIEDASVKPGAQIGAGFQMTSMFGLDVQYVWTKNTHNSVDLTMNGVEFVLHATF